jgi:hypothetical protein
MTTPAGYELFLFDHTGTRQRLLTGWNYFEFTQRIGAPWNHVLRYAFTRNSETLTFIRESLERDWILEAYRTDETTGVKDLVYEGLNRTVVDQVNSAGAILVTLYGVGYTQLLTRRIVIPATGEEHSVKSGPAETIIKEFIDEQMVNPEDPTRIMPGLSIATDQASGDTAEYSARYTNLNTVVTRCAEQGGLDFGIVGSGTQGEFEFQCRTLWGEDRRFGFTSDDTPPVVFDLFLNNMEIPIFSKSGGDERNVVYVGGPGQGLDREILEIQLADEVVVSPWNRQESFVDARSQDGSNGMQTVGQAYLNKNKYLEKFTFNLRQTDGTRWLRNWNLGDLVTARYFNEEFNKKLVEVSVIISAGETGATQEEIITAEMEDI